MSIFKNILILIIMFLITSSCLANPINQSDEATKHASEDSNNVVLSTIALITQSEDSIASFSILGSEEVALIRHHYPDYKFYDSPCYGSYTQSDPPVEYLIPMLSPVTQSIKYLLLTAKKNGSYNIIEFGNLKLTEENAGWQFTMCGDNDELLKRWKSKERQTVKWFRKPLNNGLGYFCIIKDKSSYKFTCYQYNKISKKFNKIYGTYWGDY